MSSSLPSLWILELGEGRAHVHLAGVAHLSVPVVELRPGDSYRGLAYQDWAAYLGETVDVAMLERDSAQMSATSVNESELDRQLVERLRRRTGRLFVISAVLGGLWALRILAAYPYWGYAGVVPLFILMLLVPLGLLWCRIAGLMLSPTPMPILAESIVGWVHITIGAVFIVMGMSPVSGPHAEISGRAFIWSLSLLGLGAIFFEGGRSYLQLWHAQERAASSREATPDAPAE